MGRCAWGAHKEMNCPICLETFDGQNRICRDCWKIFELIKYNDFAKVLRLQAVMCEMLKEDQK